MSGALFAAWNWRRIVRFDVWGVVFWLNAVALGAIVVGLAVSMRRDRVEREAPNAVEFLPDEDLEGPRLERVLGWSLFFFAVFAVSLPLYWLRETAREKASVNYFNENAVKRGAELFANQSSPEVFNSAKSLQCANCHGVGGVGGSAPYTYTDPNTGKAYKVAWKAPALNTVLYRFSPQEVNDIITGGRPGTPMQPWGIKGGGSKNAQSINDLVAYLASIQLPPGTPSQVEADLRDCSKAKTARGATNCALAAARGQADQQVKDARKALADAKKKKTDDQKAFAQDQDQATAGTQTCTEILVGAAPSEARVKCRDLERAIRATTDGSGKPVPAADDTAIADAQAALDWALEWRKRRAGVTDGQLLFELSCARCHTKNWSIFDPTRVDLKPEKLLGPPGGGGQSGFNLRDGQAARRFPNTRGADGQAQPYSGLLSQIAFVINGSDAGKLYGVGGIGNGKMPGQCNEALKSDKTVSLRYYGCLLSYASDATNLAGTPAKGDDPSTALDETMIEQIVRYERCGLDATDASLTPPSSSYSTNCS